MGCLGGDARGLCPAAPLLPPYSNSRRHLVPLEVKLSQGTGCQTCAAAGIAGWAPPASLEQHRLSQHISQQEFCHRAGL